jgi:hypothetical protein
VTSLDESVWRHLKPLNYGIRVVLIWTISKSRWR